MQRDFDLIREALITIDGEGPLVFSQDEDGAEILFQLTLLHEAGFIKGAPFKGGISVQRLTFEGYDFLAAIQDDTVWNRTKTKIGGAVGSASLAVVKAVAEGIATSMLKGGGL